MVRSIVVLFLALGVILPLRAEDPVKTEASFRVTGNCGQCKSRIEKAARASGASYAKWDKKKQMLSVRFTAPPLSADSLQRAVAAAGHDTETYAAPDSVYAELPGCCLYRDAHDVH